MHQYEVDRYISEMVEIEDAIYDILESRYEQGKSGWMTLPELSVELINYHRKIYTLTLNGEGIDGMIADYLVCYFCLDYYMKVQKGHQLDIIQQQFPKRRMQIAVAKHPNSGEYRVRRRLFKRISERL